MLKIFPQALLIQNLQTNLLLVSAMVNQRKNENHDHINEWSYVHVSINQLQLVQKIMPVGGALNICLVVCLMLAWLVS